MVLDHLSDDPFVTGLQSYTPDMSGLKKAAAERQFSPDTRSRLLQVLERQYSGLDVHEEVAGSLTALAQEDTLTVTTGHQLCLFTGPLYVPLKIMNTVRLARDLQQELKGRRVVPVFWMATEDHDREEVDHAWLHGRKYQWQGEASGAMGRATINAMDGLLAEVDRALGPGSHADHLRSLIQASYVEGRTLADATRHFVNGLFGRFGIICLDADDPELKREFLPVVEEELLHRVVETTLKEQQERIGSRYKVQAPAREINLFLLEHGERHRLQPGGGAGEVVVEGRGKDRTAQLLEQFRASPEKCSPNVLLRPVYQEMILPNVAYVGGGGELAYWMQLKPLFQQLNVPMPVVLLRTSVAIMPHKEHERMLSLGLKLPDIFLPVHQLEASVAAAHAGFRTNMSQERADLKAIFDALKQRARSVDPTLEASTASAETRADHLLVRLEKRFVRAAKGKARQDVDRLHMVLDTLFPGGGLQERRENFMTSFARHGEALFDVMLATLDPLDRQFTVLVEDPVQQEPPVST
jgi:bacillithiol synthase